MNGGSFETVEDFVTVSENTKGKELLNKIKKHASKGTGLEDIVFYYIEKVREV